MLAAWSPVATACARELTLARRLGLERLSRLLRRLPETAPGEPLEHSVWLLLANSGERGQELVALYCAKGCGEPTGHNGPIRISGWHENVSSRCQTTDLLDQRRAFQTKELRGLVAIATGALK